jgi:hypothetical protein
MIFRLKRLPASAPPRFLKRHPERTRPIAAVQRALAANAKLEGETQTLSLGPYRCNEQSFSLMGSVFYNSSE